MTSRPSPLDDWTPEAIEQARRWVEAWRLAGPELERLRRSELRRLDLDGRRAIARLCGPADYRAAPRLARPTSGLVQQQYWFMKAARRE